MFAHSLALGALAGLAAAQFPPEPEGIKVLRSKFHENVTISYKEPNICESDQVKSYAGHVHLPPGLLDDVNGEKQDYPINTFFYFFEARVAPEDAPLAIWLNGGPGGSSLLGLFQENGPCIVNDDSQTSQTNPWSWNTLVNMLYIDQPNQVGFSYDEPTNVTYEAVAGDFNIVPTDFSTSVPESNYTHRVGTSSSQDLSHTANTTAQAAHALWHFAQTWFSEFPHYKPNDDRISMWAESYGGHYGPGFFRFFQEQNEKIQDGTIDEEHAHYLHLDTLGIVNGYLDAVIQGEAYIEFPYNNTFDIQVFDQPLYDELMHNWTRPDGCRDQTVACQKKLSSLDVASVNRGLVAPVDACDMADWCQLSAVSKYVSLDRGWLDIAHPFADPFPLPHMHGYLAQEHILAAIGSPVNFTSISPTVASAFAATHDEVHGSFLDAVAYLLDSGVKVHMVYGDRDYACSWTGGEAASLAVPYSRQADFADAPYGLFQSADLDAGPAGLTRQLGNFSFTRIFQAGHMVPSYQPEAAYEHFVRATFHVDIGTGTRPVTDDLITEGEAQDPWVKQPPPEFPEPRCYVLQPSSCTEDVWERVAAGKATVRDYYVVDLGEDKDDGEEAGPAMGDGDAQDALEL
ncbi:hypothetical protein ACO1O0_008278 [Amphichorda felina]